MLSERSLSLDWSAAMRVARALNNFIVIITTSQRRVDGGDLASSGTDELAEGLAEFRIEERVDNGVDEAVHVAEPGGRDERRDARLAVRLHLGA